MIKANILLLTAVAFFCSAGLSHAELNEAEEQVIAHMNYLQEMSYTAEYTEGMSKEDVEAYLNENISYISETYKISPENIQWLKLYKHNKKPLPETYAVPTMPTDEQKLWLKEKMKSSVEKYSKT